MMTAPNERTKLSGIERDGPAGRATGWDDPGEVWRGHADANWNVGWLR